jgi:transcriptional regulator with XRE-family HTH domain
MTGKPSRIHPTQTEVSRVLTMFMAKSRDCKYVAALAKRSGVSTHTIRRILDGEETRVGTLAFICDALRVSLKTFFEHVEAKRPIKYQKLVFVP